MGFVFFTFLIIICVIGTVTYFLHKRQNSNYEREMEETLVDLNINVLTPTPTPVVEEHVNITPGLLNQDQVNQLKKTRPVRKKAAPKKTSRKRK